MVKKFVIGEIVKGKFGDGELFRIENISTTIYYPENHTDDFQLLHLKPLITKKDRIYVDLMAYSYEVIPYVDVEGYVTQLNKILNQR